MRCPHCNPKNASETSKKTGKGSVQKCGVYRRTSDSKTIQRYLCLNCKKTFSAATTQPECNQNKRRLNYKIKVHLSSLCSMRRIAKILHINRKTVARKLQFLGEQSLINHQKALDTQEYHATAVQFDELQTIEHTKCKPLSVAVAVSETNRKILGIAVSSMPATGHLARVSVKKYGYRPDKRQEGLVSLCKQIAPVIHSKTTLYSDQHPYYKPVISKYFPGVPYPEKFIPRTKQRQSVVFKL